MCFAAKHFSFSYCSTNTTMLKFVWIFQYTPGICHSLFPITEVFGVDIKTIPKLSLSSLVEYKLIHFYFCFPSPIQNKCGNSFWTRSNLGHISLYVEWNEEYEYSIVSKYSNYRGQLGSHLSLISACHNFYALRR